MKQYIKNILMLMCVLTWGIALTGCSDDEADYSDDNAFPPPAVEITSFAEITEVEYNSTVTVSATSSSAVGIHSIYATLMKLNVIARVRHLLCHARLISVVILHISEACPKKRYVFLVRLIGMACLSPRLRILVEFLQEIYIIFMMVGLRPIPLLLRTR